MPAFFWPVIFMIIAVEAVMLAHVGILDLIHTNIDD